MGGKSSRNKGGGGEREVASWLNEIIRKVMILRGFTAEEIAERMPVVRRNQDQSANGGADLIGTFGLAIEIKRQETLSIPAWWRQAKSQAPPDHLPVLLYRQNRKQWKAMTYAWSAMPEGEGGPIVVTMSKDVFSDWFRQWVNWSFENAPEGTWPA